MNGSMNNQQDAMAAFAGWRCWGGLKQPAAKRRKALNKKTKEIAKCFGSLLTY
jgi:hypothetical protein